MEGKLNIFNSPLFGICNVGFKDLMIFCKLLINFYIFFMSLKRDITIHINNVYLWILSCYTVQIQPLNYIFSFHYQFLFIYLSIHMLMKENRNWWNQGYKLVLCVSVCDAQIIICWVSFVHIKLWLLYKNFNKYK